MVLGTISATRRGRPSSRLAAARAQFAGLPAAYIMSAELRSLRDEASATATG